MNGALHGFLGVGLLRSEFINTASFRRALLGGFGRDDRVSVVRKQRSQLFPESATKHEQADQ